MSFGLFGKELRDLRDGCFETNTLIHALATQLMKLEVYTVV